MLNMLRPAADIRKRVHDLPRYCVGVHVRRTDNFHIWHSPLELFFEALDLRLFRVPDTVFFLATDDPSVEDAFVERYGRERILTHPKRSLQRRHRVAIQDALVDLLHLAQTEEIYGSFGSAFSELAGLFRRQPVHILHRPLNTADEDAVVEALTERIAACSKYPTIADPLK